MTATSEVKLVYGLNSPDEFQDSKAKLEASGAAGLLEKVATVLQGAEFSLKGRPGGRWPEVNLAGPRTSENPDLLSSVYFSKVIRLGSLSVSYATLVPDRICVEVNNGWISVGHEGRGNSGGGSRIWETDLSPDVGRQELAEAIFNGLKRVTNFDRSKTEEVRDALGLTPSEPQTDSS